MPVRNGIIIAAAILFATAFAQQPSESTVPASGALPAQAVPPLASPLELLDQAYLLGGQLWPEDRAWLLLELVYAASEMRHPSLEQWVNELMQGSMELALGSDDRLVLQKNALIALSSIDPAQALRRLTELDSLAVAVPQAEFLAEDVRSDAARQILPRYWNGAESPDLMALRSVSQHLGNTGQYPFAGIALILKKVAANDPRFAELFFLDALEFYRRPQLSLRAHQDFFQLLKEAHRVVPDSMQQVGVELAIQLLLSDEKKEGVTDLVRVKTSRGVLEFHSQADYLLYQLIPLIREYSPGAAEELVEKRPLLKESLESGEVATRPEDTEFIGIRGGENPAAVSELQSRGLERSRLQNAQALAASDPDAAVQMSAAITDTALRARALAGIARRIQKNDPARAERLMQEAVELLESVKDELDRLNVIVQLARGYAASDHPELWNTLKRGLELGEELFERDIRLFPGTPAFNARGFDEVTELTQIACEKQADSAWQWLSAQHSPLLKSNLLVSAAKGFWAAQQH